jgi:hypothetical protein
MSTALCVLIMLHCTYWVNYSFRNTKLVFDIKFQ